VVEEQGRRGRRELARRHPYFEVSSSELPPEVLAAPADWWNTRMPSSLPPTPPEGTRFEVRSILPYHSGMTMVQIVRRTMVQIISRETPWPYEENVSAAWCMEVEYENDAYENAQADVTAVATA
jgi:hypothetical protein